MGGAVILAAILFSDNKVTPLFLKIRRGEGLYLDLIKFENMLGLEIGRIDCEWMFHSPGRNAIGIFLELEWRLELFISALVWAIRAKVLGIVRKRNLIIEIII